MLDPSLKVLTFIGYKQTDRQTNRHPDKPNFYIEGYTLDPSLNVTPARHDHHEFSLWKTKLMSKLSSLIKKSYKTYSYFSIIQDLSILG